MKNTGVFFAVAVLAIAIAAKLLCPDALDICRERISYALTCNVDYTEKLQTVGRGIYGREKEIIAAFEDNVLRREKENE